MTTKQTHQVSLVLINSTENKTTRLEKVGQWLFKYLDPRAVCPTWFGFVNWMLVGYAGGGGGAGDSVSVDRSVTLTLHAEDFIKTFCLLLINKLDKLYLTFCHRNAKLYTIYRCYQNIISPFWLTSIHKFQHVRTFWLRLLCNLYFKHYVYGHFS